MNHHPTDIEIALLWAVNAACWLFGHINETLQGLVLLTTLILSCLRIHDYLKGRKPGGDQ